MEISQENMYVDIGVKISHDAKYLDLCFSCFACQITLTAIHIILRVKLL